MSDQKVNCKVHTIADGSKHLVFTVEGTQQCVGEIRVAVADERYLIVMSQLFSTWARQQRGVPVLPAAIRHILSGNRSA